MIRAGIHIDVEQVSLNNYGFNSHDTRGNSHDA